MRWQLPPIPKSGWMPGRLATLEILARGMVIAVTRGKVGFSRVTLCAVIVSLPDVV